MDASGGSTVFDVREPGVTIERVVVTGAANAAIRVLSDNFTLMNSWIVGNAGKGIFLGLGTAPLVFNNIVAENENSGIVLGGRKTGVQEAHVAQNTVYGNDNRGITVGLGSEVPSEARITNNVISGSRPGKGGVAVGESSAALVEVQYNCNTDGYEGIAAPVTDIGEDPLLLAPDARDFHLADRSSGQEATSPCINAGFGSARALDLQESSTRSDQVSDRGTADIGFHYGLQNADPEQVRRVLAGEPAVDCDGDGHLAIDELVRGIRIAAEIAPLTDCPVFDQDGDGHVRIDELIFAVTEALK